MPTVIKLSSLAADLTKEREGDVYEPSDLPGVKLRVRSIHYEPFKVARAEASRVLEKKYGADDSKVPEEESARVNGGLLCDHLLIGWDGFDVEFAPEVARRLLTALEHRRLRELVSMAALQAGRRQVEFVDDAAKN